MESFKSRRKKRTNTIGSSNRDAVFYDSSVKFESGQTNNSDCINDRLKPPTLVLGTGHLQDELTKCSLTSNEPLKNKNHSKKSNGRRGYGHSVKKIDAEALSDSECSSATSPSAFPAYLLTGANSNNSSLIEQCWKASRLFPVSPGNVSPTKDSDDGEDKRERISVYENVPLVFFNSSLSIDKDQSKLLKHVITW